VEESPPAPAADLTGFPAVIAGGSIAPVEVAAAPVPGFTILRPIATTTRGWVSLATQESDQRTVALKTTRMTGEPGSSTLRRFTREYTVLAHLADANVIRVFRHGFAQNCGFVASEYCQGGNLEQKIERGIPVSNAVDYLAQIMRGLGAVHAHGILHRDIKPSNLLFREDGTLVLTDLATERELSDNPRLTTKSLVGDLNYVSPESIRRGTVDLRSDLYSAGVVLYQMLTGQRRSGAQPWRRCSRRISTHRSRDCRRVRRFCSRSSTGCSRKIRTSASKAPLTCSTESTGCAARVSEAQLPCTRASLREQRPMVSSSLLF